MGSRDRRSVPMRRSIGTASGHVSGQAGPQRTGLWRELSRYPDDSHLCIHDARARARTATGNASGYRDIGTAPPVSSQRRRAQDAEGQLAFTAFGDAPARPATSSPPGRKTTKSVAASVAGLPPPAAPPRTSMSVEAVAAAVDGVVIYVGPEARSEQPESCYACNGNDFWSSRWRDRICRRCHPPAQGLEALP